MTTITYLTVLVMVFLIEMNVVYEKQNLSISDKILTLISLVSMASIIYFDGNQSIFFYVLPGIFMTAAFNFSIKLKQ